VNNPVGAQRRLMMRGTAERDNQDVVVRYLGVVTGVSEAN
jgi:hypothetical protein